MTKRYNLSGIGAAAGFLILIFDSSAAMEGARAGIDLCLKTVIPALFPFFLLAPALTGSLWNCRGRWLNLAAGFLGIPGEAAGLLIPSFLGGYPVGAGCVADLYRRGQLSARDGKRLLTFCNNPGPSFLFGMVAQLFPQMRTVVLLWLINIAGAILTARVFREGSSGQNHSCCQEKPLTRPDIMITALRTMGIVCGWVVLFRIIITFVRSWLLWLFPDWLQVLLSGFLELSNGCCDLMGIQDGKLRFVLCACMLSFGGISVVFQTASVAGDLGIISYLRGKLVQTLFCLLLSCAVTSGSGVLYAAAVPGMFLLLKKSKIKVAIRNRFLYNDKKMWRNHHVVS